MNEEREKLERELNFLKDSLDAGVITKEEFDRNKERIDKKLSDRPEENIEIVKLQDIKSKEDQKLVEEVKRKEEEKKALEAKVPEVIQKEKDIQDITMQVRQEPEKKEGSFIRKILWFIILLILIGGVFYTFNHDDVEERPNIEDNSLSGACTLDSDCLEDGKKGLCRNSGNEDAFCEFIDLVAVELKVINGDECKICDTSRVISLLTGLFPGLKVVEVDSDAEEGKKLISSLGIKMIPAYVFSGDFKDTSNFNKVSRAFEEVNGKYLMSEDAAGAQLFLFRSPMNNKIDVIYSKDSENAEKVKNSLKEVRDLFGGKIILVEHDLGSNLGSELDVKTTPLFLINNRVKLFGVQSSESIKNNFCEYNEHDECDIVLSEIIK